MISLEQVQLLEEKVAKAIEFVERLTLENTELSSLNLDLELKSNNLELENKKLIAENKNLASERASLISKMEANQKRIDDLELHVLRFKEDQSRIEDGIIAALDRLSQFEQAFENSLKDTQKPPAKKPQAQKKTSEPQAKQVSNNDKPKVEPAPNTDAAEKEVFFEIPKEDASQDDDESSLDNASSEAELDIF